MESTIDLILKGHFEKLKEQVNNNPIATQRAADLQHVLIEVVDYLEKSNDKQGRLLKEKLLEALPTQDFLNTSEVMKLGKKPMQKAGQKKKASNQKKAM